MDPLFHFASTAVVLPFGIKYLSKPALVGFFLSAAFLDIDHYFFYIYKFKHLGLKKAWQFYQSIRHQPKKVFCFFHTIEFLLLIIFLNLVMKTQFFYGFLIGLIFHLLIDLAQAIYYQEVNYRFWSFWQYLFK